MVTLISLLTLKCFIKHLISSVQIHKLQLQLHNGHSMMLNGLHSIYPQFTKNYNLQLQLNT